MEKGVVCVTGGTGFVASWLVMRLLQHGYAVNTTIRSHPGKLLDYYNHSLLCFGDFLFINYFVSNYYKFRFFL